jgi:sulfotransferase family protein
MNKKIDVMIVGAQKAGTTSLLRYLGEHPECVSHQQKEFAYFLDSNEYENNYDIAYKKYFSNKPIDPNTKVIAKSAGLYAEENAISRLYEHNPECKLIIILRNPVERAYSSYLMEKNYGSVKFEFSELPDLIKKHAENDVNWGFDFFINYGLYLTHLKNIYKYFPKDHVKIVLYSELENAPLVLCKNIFGFISVDTAFIPNIHVKHNVTQKTRSKTFAKAIMRVLKKGSTIRSILIKLIPTDKAYKYGELLRNSNRTNQKHSKMDENVRQFLIDYYRPLNEELGRFIGKDLSEWNN